MSIGWHDSGGEKDDTISLLVAAVAMKKRRAARHTMMEDGYDSV